MEPYDPRKIPVLIIHGAVGTPLGWEKIVDCMDKEHFQAWFYYYPSGLALEKSSKALNQMLAALHRQYGFQKMHVIANSMGDWSRAISSYKTIMKVIKTT